MFLAAAAVQEVTCQDENYHKYCNTQPRTQPNDNWHVEGIFRWRMGEEYWIELSLTPVIFSLPQEGARKMMVLYSF